MPQPPPQPDDQDQGSYDTLRVVINSNGAQIIPPQREMLDDDSVSVDHRTIPMYRLHGVNHLDDLSKPLNSLKSSFTDGEPRFQVKASLGEGSQGLVMRVRDRDCRRDVALKTLHHSGCNLDEISRFIHEAQVTAQLEHPAIVPVHDVGVLADGTVFYTMKRIEGTNLAEYLTERAGREECRYDLLELFLRVCDAMAFAHSRGVIHRDLKPRNIMVGAFGEVLVLDWGLAKILGQPTATHERGNPKSIPDSDGDIHRTIEGYAVGTPAYMSPEQARGNDRALVDQRCDVYSLGVILYELLCGVSPYQRSNVRKTLEQVARGQWIPLQRQPGAKRLPKRLVAIVHKAMVMDPDHRYQTVSALVDDLRNFIAGRPVSVYRENLVENLARQLANHRRLVISVTATVALAIVVFVAWHGWQVHEEDSRIETWRQAAHKDRASGNSESALTWLERILGQRPGDVQALNERSEVKRDLTDQEARRASIQTQNQKRADAAQLIRNAQDKESIGGEVQLREAAECYLKALGLTPDDRALSESWQKVTTRLAEIDSSRRIREVSAATEVDRRTKAEQLVKEAHDLADKRQYQEALAKVKGAISLNPAVSDFEFIQVLGNNLKEQQDQESRAMRRKEADNLYLEFQDAMQRIDTTQATNRLEHMRALWAEDPRIDSLNAELSVATQRASEKVAEKFLAQARIAQNKANDYRRKKEEILESMRLSEARLMEHGEAKVREELHALDLQRIEYEKQCALAQTDTISKLRKAESRNASYPPVQDALAEYFVDMLLQAETEGRIADAAIAEQQARGYDKTGRFTTMLNGMVKITCASGSCALRLTPIVEQADRRAGTTTEDSGLTLKPGETRDVPQGRYEITNEYHAVTARLFYRGQDRGKEIIIELPKPPTLPPGMIYVPSGEAFVPDRNHTRQVAAFAISQYEITCAEWLEFVNSPENLQRYSDEAQGHLVLVPRASYDSTEPLWRQQPVPMWQKRPGNFVLETTANPSTPIRGDRPVTGVSAEDIECYLRWRSTRDHLVWRLPTPDEWILAAQGGDGRAYPWGDHADPSFCASGLVAEQWIEKLSVGVVPTDRSVQGVCDLAGGVSELTSGHGADDHLRVVMGGNYLDRIADRFLTRSRRELDARQVSSASGFRLALSVP